MQSIDINIVYNALTEKLKEFNFQNIIVDIEKSSAGAATSSEALMNQGSYLLSLRQSNPSAFKLMQEEINQYLEYCKRNGLVLRQ